MINRRFMIVPPALPSGGRTEQLGGQARNIRACSLKWRTWEWIKSYIRVRRAWRTTASLAQVGRHQV